MSALLFHVENILQTNLMKFIHVLIELQAQQVNPVVEPKLEEPVKSSAEQPDEPESRIDETPQIPYFEDNFRRPLFGPESKAFQQQQQPQQQPQHHHGHNKRPSRRQDHARGNR